MSTLSVLLLSIGGCEDDPILQPTDDTSGGGGGSYGRIDKIGVIADSVVGRRDHVHLKADPAENPATF